MNHPTEVTALVEYFLDCAMAHRHVCIRRDYLVTYTPPASRELSFRAVLQPYEAPDGTSRWSFEAARDEHGVVQLTVELPGVAAPISVKSNSMIAAIDTAFAAARTPLSVEPPTKDGAIIAALLQTIERLAPDGGVEDTIGEALYAAATNAVGVPDWTDIVWGAC